MKGKEKTEVVIPKGIMLDEWCDTENDYADEKAIREEEVTIRFER